MMVSAGKEYGGGYQTCGGCKNCWQKKKRVTKTQMAGHKKLFPPHLSLSAEDKDN